MLCFCFICLVQMLKLAVVVISVVLIGQQKGVLCSLAMVCFIRRRRSFSCKITSTCYVNFTV